MGNLIAIVNMYAPTKDSTIAQNDFFEKLHSLVLLNSDVSIIIAGDFNICLNLENDKKGGTVNGNSTYRNILLNLLEENDLADIWRCRHQDKHRYTWHGKGKAGLVQSRLDFFNIEFIRTTSL